MLCYPAFCQKCTPMCIRNSQSSSSLPFLDSQNASYHPKCDICNHFSWDAKLAALNDECLDSAVVDTDECQLLFLDILEFYEGLNMQVTQQIPLLLVERQAQMKQWMGGDMMVERTISISYCIEKHAISGKCSCQVEALRNLDYRLNMESDDLNWFLTYLKVGILAISELLLPPSVIIMYVVLFLALFYGNT